MLLDTDRVEQEAPHEDPEHRPLGEWPSAGGVEFKDVVMAYRDDLQPTLKGVTFSVKAGEKIGIVGRYGSAPVSSTSILTHISQGLGLESRPC